MEIIESKRPKDSIIILKTRLLNFTNTITNVVSTIGLTSFLLPIPQELKKYLYIFIIICLIYSSINGNDAAKKIIKERVSKGDIFDPKSVDNNTLVKLSYDELNKIKGILK
jgi:hypothetical protein